MTDAPHSLQLISGASVSPDETQRVLVEAAGLLGIIVVMTAGTVAVGFNWGMSLC